MPFLNSSQISSDLPTNFDVKLVDRFLLKLEQEFKNMYLVFEPQVQETREIHSEEALDSIFDFTPVKEIFSVKIKSYNSSYEKILINKQDYVLSSMNNFNEYFNRIKLLNVQISFDHYIEITGKFGIYIDTTSTTNEASKLLKSVVVEATLKELSFASSNYQSISSSTTGKSQVSFINNRKYYSSISSDPEFQNYLNYFL